MKKGSGWIVSKSILLELSFGISFFQHSKLQIANEFTKSEWFSNWESLWNNVWKPNSIISHIAELSDSLLEADYFKATLAARQLNFIDAYQKLKTMASSLDIDLETTLCDQEHFVELAVSIRNAAHKRDGFEWNPELNFAQKTKQQYQQLLRVLRDGDLYDRFWQLIEQFYYEYYKPWRLTKLTEMNNLKDYVVSQLGSDENSDKPPSLDWLTVSNPLRFLNVFSQTIAETATKVFFWIDPFSNTESISIRHNLFIVSCSKRNSHNEEVHQQIEELTNRIKAISDPTRITILNMIRFFSMDNTQMANMLQIARPTVSVHTKILRDAGLIESFQAGRSTKHRVNFQAVSRLVKDIDRFINVDKLNT